ncbi:DUF1883 domain-containing protein [Streptomyces sp. NBC_00076]|uniref:DUF1883 domain-containing protein n=1 Tax=Streptomyces sp. NBC_00076 TaxID=2975642 RepID=UPI00386E4121
MGSNPATPTVKHQVRPDAERSASGLICLVGPFWSHLGADLGERFPDGSHKYCQKGLVPGSSRRGLPHRFRHRRPPGKSYRYLGGRVSRSPHQITIPSNGQWVVTIDLGGYSGRISASVQSSGLRGLPAFAPRPAGQPGPLRRGP